MFIRIADVILDIEAGRATAGSRDVPLSPRLFATVRALAARPDEVVTREELMRAVWPDTHVDPNNLSQAVAAVRRALADTGAAGRVQTVPGRGYMLTGPIETFDTPPAVAGRRRLAVRLALAAACVALLVGGGRDHARSHGPGGPPPPVWLADARDLLETRAPAGMQRAATALARGVAREPANAGAWVSLAEAHHLLGFYGLADAGASARAAVDAASRAIALDPGSGRAYAVRAAVTLDAGWDLAGSARDFRRAVDADGDDPLVQHWLAWWCLAADRLPEARAAVDRAVRLQPLSASALTARATFAYLDGDPRGAIADATRVLDMDPAFFRAHLRMGLSHLALGDARAGLGWVERAYALAPQMPEVTAALAHARAVAGDREGAERLYAARRADLSAYDEAIVLTGLGRPFDALGRLEAARRDGRLTPGLFAAEPRLAPLHAAPAFGRLLAGARAAHPALLTNPLKQ